MRYIFDWTAKRAGGRITIYGKELEPGLAPRKELEVRIPNVDKISPKGQIIVAIDKNGFEYRLSAQSGWKA